MEPNNNKPDEQVKDSTTVEQIDVNIDEIFGMPGAESIMLPEEEKPKSMFSKESKLDTSFFDNKIDSEKNNQEVKPEEIESTINELNELIIQEEDAGNKGRPKVDKSGLYELAQKMIEDGALVPFDDDKDLEEYTTKDFRELFEANFQEREAQVRENVPKEFFQALPQELQIAAKYVADGGTDLKGLFRTLAYVEEIVQLDPESTDDQEEIARQYLSATNFGTYEEIESEIDDWRDLGKLEQKALQFKPKLDKMQEKLVARQLAEQESKKKQQEDAAKYYIDNVYSTLSIGEVGGIKLDKKTQSLLYTGLVQPSYPSISGKPTNLLGHLLEKYQFVEPRHDLIAEALWLLADPDGYKSKIKDQGSKQAVEKTVRQLKTEQSRKITSSVNDDREYDPKTRTSKPQKTLSRTNMFKRF
jgi:hypothetical protein